MLLKIAQLGQPVLWQPAEAVPPEQVRSDEFQRFLDDMIETLTEAKGVGLAGPQVFAGRRVFLAAVLPPEKPDEPRGLEVFINPRVVALTSDKAAAWEGCLSFSELLVLVPRYRRVRIDYLNRQGESRSLELEDFPARVVQHELDHLNGILTLDRAESSRNIIKASEIDTVLKKDETTDDTDGHG
jgi:peptide deformylase